jgi:peptide/nickel transport system substrate-binding protein
MKSVSEGTTRVAMLKKGEADMAFLLEGPDAENVTRDPRFTLVATRHASAMWIEFAEQWDAKSPWHDRRVRLALNYALDRRAISETACLGYCPSLGVIVPPVMDYALKVEPLPLRSSEGEAVARRSRVSPRAGGRRFHAVARLLDRRRGRGH